MTHFTITILRMLQCMVIRRMSLLRLVQRRGGHQPKSNSCNVHPIALSEVHVKQDRAEPPRCVQPCRVPRLCRHAAALPAHRCHFEPCPPCPERCGSMQVLQAPCTSSVTYPEPQASTYPSQISRGASVVMDLKTRRSKERCQTCCDAPTPYKHNSFAIHNHIMCCAGLWPCVRQQNLP